MALPRVGRPVSTPSTPPKTEGERLLRAVVQSRGLLEVARQCGDVAHQTVRDWSRGKFKPKAVPANLLAQKYAIPVDAWQVAHDAPRAAPAPALPAAPPAQPPPDPGARPLVGMDVTAKELSRRNIAVLMVEVETALAEMRAGKITRNEYAAMNRCYQVALQHFGRFGGEMNVTVGAVLGSSAWLKIRVLFEEIAANYPDAAGYIAERLEKLAEDGG
jgi:hypothetical protein